MGITSEVRHLKARDMKIPPLPDGLNPRKQVFRMDKKETAGAVFLLVLLLIGNLVDMSAFGAGADRIYAIVVLGVFAMAFIWYNHVRRKSLLMQQHVESKVAIYAAQQWESARVRGIVGRANRKVSDATTLDPTQQKRSSNSKFSA